jgi:phosphoribosylanthranilate isomerase
MFVKICGITSVAATDAAINAGADALGFVFADSPRRVSMETARELAGRVPAHIMRVAVMRHPTAALAMQVLETFEPDWVQTDAADLKAISLPVGCRALPVYRNGRIADRAPLPARLLFEGSASGAGSPADWTEAAELARNRELILAGGLTAENVAAAIATVRPWGVDVSSCVERSRGVKDEKRIAEFVARVRALENRK